MQVIATEKIEIGDVVTIEVDPETGQMLIRKTLTKAERDKLWEEYYNQDPVPDIPHFIP